MATQSISLRSTPSRVDAPELAGRRAGLWQAIQVADAAELLRWTRWSISAVCLIALTHVLAPSSYGLALIAAIGVSLLGTLQAGGRDLSPKTTASYFWLNASLGLFGAILMASLAAPAARFFEEPVLAAVMPFAGLLVLLESLVAIPVALLVRQRRYSTLAFAQLVAAGAGFTLALGLAFQGMGVWSLVYGSLLHGVALFACILNDAPELLGGRPDWAVIRRAVWPEQGTALTRLETFAARHLDKALVGSALGVAALGTYQIAWAIAVYPLTLLGNAVINAVFPADQRDGDEAQFRASCLRTARALGWICLPVMLALGIAAKPLVNALMGPAWNASVTPLVVFAAMSAFQVLLPVASLIYRAKGRTELVLGSQVGSAVVASITAGIGLRWGISGAAIGFAIGSILFAIPNLCVAFRLIDVKGKDLAHAIWPAINISLITSLAAFFWLTTLNARIPHAPAALQLLSTVGLAVAVYFFLLRAMRPAGMEDVEMMLARLPKPFRAWRKTDRRAAHTAIGELQLR